MPLVPGTGDSQRKTKPNAPVITSQSDSGSGRAFNNGATFLTFQAPDYTGKLPITEYVITASATDASDTLSSSISPSLSTFVVEGLKSGKKYKYKIKSKNIVYESDDSVEAGPVDATTVPGTPTSLGGNDLKNGGGLSLAWTAPPNAGIEVTSYTITPSYGPTVSTGNNSTSYTFSGLEVNRGYTFTVQAVNANGPGITSTPSPTLTPTLYVAPTPTPPTSSGPSVTAPPSQQNSYYVSACCNGSPTSTVSGVSFAAAQSAAQAACSGTLTDIATLYGTSAPSVTCTSTNTGGCSSLYYSSPVVGGDCYNSTFCCSGTYNTTYACDGTITSRSCVANCSSSQCQSQLEPIGLTYCPSIGENVASSGYPGNCPGAQVAPTPVITTPPSTGGCSGFCFGICFENTGCIPWFTPTPPVEVTPTPTPACIVESTEILTTNGTILAKDVTVGTIVRSVRFAELSTDETAYSLNDWSTPVLTPVELLYTTVKSIVTRELRNEYIQINGDSVTGEHPILIYDGFVYKFKKAKDVKLNDLVLKVNGPNIEQLQWTPVTKITPIVNKAAMVYIFDTEDQDVLFTKNFLSHNLKAPITPTPTPVVQQPTPTPVVTPIRERQQCFVSSTLISTPNGSVKAEDIKIGDIVHSVKFAELSTDETVDTILEWSRNTLTPLELTTTEITNIVVKKVVDFYLNLNGDLITPEHPILVRNNGVYSFMPAGDIHLGYEVLQRTGETIESLQWVSVTSNELIEEPAMVYLFDAEEDDVIFTNNMLTHNRKL